MSKTLSPDYTRLAHERLQLEQTLYKKLLLYIMSTNVALVVVEMLRAGLSNQPEIVFTFAFLLMFIITLSTIIMRIKDRQELAITIFIGSYYLVGLIACYYGKSGYFDTPQGTFYLAYALALFERVVIARIPTSSYKIGFSICTTIIRSAVVPSSDKGIFCIQLIYVLFGIFLDFEREKRDKNLIKSYFNSRNQLEKFKNLVVNDIPDSIAILSQDLRQCVFTNKSFSELCEISSGQCIQRYLSHFRVCEEDNADTRPSNKTLLSFLESSINQSDFLTDKKFSCNLTYLQSNITFESKVFNIVWDEIPAVAIILHDITQQQTINSLKAADAHKDALLATVSHELRTPLNGMLGMIQIMQKRNKDPESVKYLNICKNSGKLLMGLVNSILDFNQIRANKLKLNPEKINLYELLRDMVQLFELQCAQKGLDIKLNISSSAQKFIVTDQNRLSQIFVNLIGNALKFTIKGGITLFARGSSNGRYVQLGVEDTGIGIKDEDKGKLFKMFGKLEQDDLLTNQQGVGLGLTISDNLARLLCKDGRKEGISLRSRYGEGSIFYFWIKSSLMTEINYYESFDSQCPVHEGNISISERMKTYSTLNNKEPTFKRLETLSESHSSITMSNDNNTTFSQNKIDLRSIFNSKDESQAEFRDTSPSKPESYVLIVDDNPFNITVAEYLVTSHGYKVKTALYGRTAIDILLKNNYNTEPIKLVLMDCLMPIMDGYETTKALKKLMSQKKIPEVPIVALTANNSEADKEASRKAGMCEHLTKPLKETELYRILSKYASKKYY